jgi:hypothetical protein
MDRTRSAPGSRTARTVLEIGMSNDATGEPNIVVFKIVAV